MQLTKQPNPNAPILLRKSLGARLFLALTFIAVTTIIGLGFASYLAERQALQKQVTRQLISVSRLKVEQLETWLNMRREDARLLAVNRLNQDHFDEILSNETPLDRREEYAKFVTDNLISVQQSRAGYVEISMLDADGWVVLSTDPDLVGRPTNHMAVYHGTMASPSDEYFQDIHFDPNSEIATMAFAHKLRALEHASSDLIGMVLIVVDMEQTVYPLIRAWPGMGDTGETLLVRADGDGTLFLNNLRFDDNAALKLHIPLDSPNAMPAHLSARGRDGVIQTTDYRGVPVLASYHHIEFTGWGFVAKEDINEAFAPIEALARRLAVAVVAVLLVASVVSVFISTTVTRPLARLAQGAQTVAAGDMTSRIDVDRQDEVGRLADSFRTMVGALQARQQQTQAMRDIMHSLNATPNVADVPETIVSTLQQATGCCYSSMALLDESSRYFTFVAMHEPQTDYGINSRLHLSQFAAAAEIMAGRPWVGDESTAPPAQSFEQQLYAAGCSTRITLPLLNSGRVIGVLNFGWSQGEHYNPSHLPIFNQISNAVAITVERSRLLDETLRRAAHLEALNGVIATVAAETDLQHLLQVALYHTRRALAVDMGAICTLQHRADSGLDDRFSTEILLAAESPQMVLDGPLVVNRWQDVQPNNPLAPHKALAQRFGIDAALLLPVLDEGRRIGSLCLFAPQARSWSTEEIALAAAVCHHLGSAASRLRLLEQSNGQALQLQQIMETVTEGVLLLNVERQVELANRMAKAYLARLIDGPADAELTQLAGVPIEHLLRPPPAGTTAHDLVLSDPNQIFELEVRRMDHGPQAGSWVLVLRDVTEERQQQQYRQAQDRLATVGQLSAGIAHDFNNIMAVIVLYSQMLIMNGNLSDKHKTFATTIFQQAKHAAKLTDQILDFSRRSVLERRPINLVPLLKEMLQLWKRTLPESIDLQLHYSDRELFVDADATRLQQALMNLVVNAHHAMPDGGALHIALDTLSLSPDQPLPLPDMTSGEWLRIAICDSGQGIKPADLPHIFEPFFTKKAPGKGTGLGLAQVHGIVKQHSGSIAVSSQVGQGTTFTIYLPALSFAGGLPLEATKGPLAKGAQETILIVEDAEAMRQALRHALDSLSYRTLVAANGGEAIDLFKHHLDDIDLVLTDVVMPEMNGITLGQRLKSLKPDIRIVLMSGYPLNTEETDNLGQGYAGQIQKPFDDSQIAAVIHDALAA